ncbi:MAG: FliM/FliN family flagellar motor switch protein [Actinomycetota bacterium]
MADTGDDTMTTDDDAASSEGAPTGEQDPAADSMSSTERNPFRQTRLLTAERSQTFNQTAEQLRERIASVLSKWLSEASVEAGPVEQVDLVDVATSDRDIAIIRPANHLDYGLIVTDLSLALPLTAILCGGPSQPEDELRALSRIEICVYDLILESTLELATDELNVGPASIGGHVAHAAALPPPPDEPSLALPFTITVGSTSGDLVFAFTAAHLQDFTEALDAQIAGRIGARETGPNNQIVQALVPVPVEIVVGFEPTQISTRRLAELDVGDVLHTGRSLASNLVARIGDESIFHVRAAQQGQRLVAEILGPVSTRKETL